MRDRLAALGLCDPLWNIATHFAPMPHLLGVLIGFGLTALPVAAIILASVGLVRSFTQPQLRRSRWQPIVGLIVGLMWVGGYFLLARSCAPDKFRRVPFAEYGNCG